MFMYAYSYSGNWENFLLTCQREGDRKSGLTKTKMQQKLVKYLTPGDGAKRHTLLPGINLIKYVSSTICNQHKNTAASYIVCI